jgi:integrase
MTQNDLLRMSPAKLNELARFYGLRLHGKRNVYWVRKSASHPVTKKQHFFKWSTGTPDLRTALLRSVPKIEHFLASVQTHLEPAVRADGDGGPTPYEKIKKIYLESGPGLPTTRNRGVSCLESIIDTAMPDRPPGDLMCGAITGRLVRLWQKELLVTLAARHLPANVEAYERAKRSANSTLAQAQAVFSRRAIRLYEDAGVSIPACVREFAAELGLEAAPPPPPRMLTDEVVQKIREAMPALKKENPAVWAAVMLMYHGGLRNSEVCKARWSWITTIGEKVMLALVTADDFTPKGTERCVLLDKFVVDELETVRIDEYLVPARNPTDRREACSRLVNDFLKDCGVEKMHGKVAYRLRSHAVSTVILRNGIDAAQEFAGHANRSTTMRHYKGVAVPYDAIRQLGPGVAAPSTPES